MDIGELKGEKLERIIELRNSCLSDSVYLKKVVVPFQVRILKSGVFENCKNLEEVCFQRTNYKGFPASTFKNCPKLKKISIVDTIETISDYAFYNTGFTTFKCWPFAEDVKSYAFADCKDLTSFTFGKKIKNIGAFCFANCKKLSDVNLPAYGKSGSQKIKIGEKAFYNCPNLKSVRLDFPIDGTIGNYAFGFKDGQDGNPQKIDGFTIYGYKGTDAELYCKDYGFKFEEIVPLAGKTAVGGIKDKTYTGKNLTQSITVKFNGKKLKNGTDYSVTYSNNKNVGTAKVTVTGKGKYKGVITKTFKINPKATKISSISAGSKKLTVSIKKASASGYQIKCSLKKNLSGAKTVTTTKTKYTIKKLKGKKKYYVAVRVYKTVSGKKYYSVWSSVKNKTTKK